jgi:hypothetical protein
MVRVGKLGLYPSSVRDLEARSIARSALRQGSILANAIGREMDLSVSITEVVNVEVHQNTIVESVTDGCHFDRALGRVIASLEGMGHVNRIENFSLGT